jgi:hypothetical protein
MSDDPCGDDHAHCSASLITLTAVDGGFTVAHLIPMPDLITHETDLDGACVCQPTMAQSDTMPVTAYRHHALDPDHILK